MIDRLIDEATECDFKVAVEVKKPKSWLKSVSAFANGAGGSRSCVEPAAAERNEFKFRRPDFIV